MAPYVGPQQQSEQAYACQMAKQKINNISPFNLRLQPELKSQLESEARKSGRSLNAEITERLEESLGAARGLAAYSDGQLLDEVIKRWGRENIKLTITPADS